MVRADQTEIFRNKHTTFGGTPLFGSNQLERNLLFNLHKISISILLSLRTLRHHVPFLIYQ